MAVISSNPSMQDLDIAFHDSTLVFPSQQTPQISFFLSNIDQILNYNVPTIYFFPPNPEYPPNKVSHLLKLALQRVLVPYHFMAGRLKLDPASNRLHIHCNAAGAGFVVASSPLSLQDIGDLVAPNVGFHQLALHTLKDKDKDDQPLIVLQLTSFRCGGFAMGLSVNHILLDGLSAKAFNQNLASQAFHHNTPLAVVPFLDRRLLAARSPPLVSFQHPEFFKPENITGPLVFDCKKEELEFKVLQFTPSDIDFLKKKAKAGRISSLSVVVALVWRCKALSKEEVYDKDRESTILNVVNLRDRLNPPLPPNYCGNPLLVAYATARCEDIDKLEFSEVVRKVAESPGRITDEYARSVIDWLEINGGLPCGEYMVSSWLKLGFEEVEFPWGKGLHTGPLPNHRKDICWIFPSASGQGKGLMINAMVSLPPPEMERFQSHFQNFFNQPNYCP